MYIVGILSFKGGVGKTTSAVNLAYAAFARGARVLLVELDAQGSATENLTRQTYPAGAAAWIMNQAAFDDIVITAREEEGGARIDLIPGDDALEMAELWLTTNAQTRRLYRLLGTLRDRYDLVLIDTPPARNFRSKNALVASDLVIVPFSAEPASFRGPSRVMQEVESVSAEVEREIPTLLLPTQYDTSNGSPSEGLVSVVIRRFGQYPEGLVLSPIPLSKRLKRAHAFGQTMYEFTPGHETCLRYDEVLDAIMTLSHARTDA